ncbi:MAG TPA: carboxylating nicotinate-nucleotide diphosphorylase [Hyphomonadaceae bacterium]|nr:carboxylating nicotinate-nucleotide diphosphorylase [Hyphomonadaceae bacterium]HPN06727.1 carboxylating nicotinate-nucleotide diphosphorylase [Hyphomonadaceae bacterium]
MSDLLPIPALPDIIIEPLVRLALEEDFGRGGDITTDAVIPAATRMRAIMGAREAGVAAGYDAARLALRLVDPDAKWTTLVEEGVAFEKGAALVRIEGSARSVLMAERVMLNFVGPLSGIATLTSRFVAEVKGTSAKVTCTRKTRPGFRALEKRAVRLGGGVNHRLGLDDAILIKDNHIAAAGGVAAALKRARAAVGHLRAIEIEVDGLDQLREALPYKPDAVLLDNMSTAMLKEAVAIVGDQAKTEASGGVRLDTVKAIAQTGVDYISSGALTHSAINLDVGLDFEA